PAWVERTQLETEENRLHRQAALRRRDADVGRIIMRDVLAAGANNDRDDQRQAVDGIGGNHQDGPPASLLPALNRVQVDEVNLAALDSHQCLPSPSASVT